MDPRPELLDLETLLRHEGWLRALVRGMVDPSRIDDVVQDTFVAALARPDAGPGPARGGARAWLAEVARNFARRARRGDQRRQRREHRAARPEAIPSTADLVARVQAQRLVARHVLGLNEPYRTTVLLRYFEGLSATAIAARENVPVATVRTRLKRGLDQLRGELTRAHGGEGAARLATAVLGVQVAVAPGTGGLVAASGSAATNLAPGATGSAALTTGILAMSIKHTVAGLSFAIVAASALSLYLSDPTSPTLAESSVDATAAQGQVPAGATDDPRTAHSDPTIGRSTQARDASVPSASVAVVMGRCVDPTGAAIPGVDVHLSGTPDRARLEAYRSDKGEVDWSRLEPQTTGADGRFAFRFVPPPPFRFDLQLLGAAVVPMVGRWERFAPGQVVDLGDVRLAAGCQVRGRVTDTRGRPVGDVHVALYPSHPSTTPSTGSGLQARESFGAQTAADGTFAVTTGVPPGMWRPEVSGIPVVTPDPCVVPAAAAAWFAEIVVATEADLPAIRGVIVDPEGRGIEGAELWMVPRPPGGIIDRPSGRDGRFAVRMRKPGPAPAVRLQVRRDGFESVTTPDIAWGTSGHRIVLRPGIDIELLVTDGDTGEPVTEYAVIVGPASATGTASHAGQHAEGRTVLARLRRGAYDIVVQPDDRTHMQSLSHPFEVSDAGPRRLAVEVFRGVQRQFVVRSKTGAEVVGSALEIVQPVRGSTVAFDTWIEQFDGSGGSGGSRAVLVDSGRTDAAGAYVLRAPPGAGYVLRVLGPGHVPHLETGVAIAADLPPLTVEVGAGARVSGRVRPLELVKQLREFAQQRRNSFEPGIGLMRRDGDGASEYFPGSRFPSSGQAPLDAQGCFELTGVPPGDWTIRLRWTGDNGSIRKNAPAGILLALTEGESRQVELDLSRLVHVEVSGRITYNGPPATGRTLLLEPEAVPGENSLYEQIPIGVDGRYRTLVVPGRYHPTLQVDANGVPAEASIQVLRGQPLRYDARFAAGEVTLRVTGEDGKPRPGVRILVRDAKRHWQVWAPDTDAAGTTRVVVPKTAARMFVWPKALVFDAEARQRFGNAHRDDPGAWERQRVALGEVEGTPGEARVVEVVVPAAAGY